MKHRPVKVAGFDCLLSEFTLAKGQECWLTFKMPMAVRFWRKSGTKFTLLQGPLALHEERSRIVLPDEAEKRIVTDPEYTQKIVNEIGKKVA